MITEVIEHITTEGDRWDLLAWRYYGDATRYEPIVAANVRVAILPVLPPGIVLHIPVLADQTAAQSANQELPPWMR